MLKTFITISETDTSVLMYAGQSLPYFDDSFWMIKEGIELYMGEYYVSEVCRLVMYISETF